MEKQIATTNWEERLVAYDVAFAKRESFDGRALKIAAVISMFIDHFSLAILIYAKEAVYRILGGGMNQEAFYARLDLVSSIGRAIGRTAFPIYCFLLVEGFFKTSSRGKYFARLAVFAALSEYGFDHALFPYSSANRHCNVFVTLAIGFLMMWVMEVFRERWKDRLTDAFDRYSTTLLFIEVLALALACFVADAVHSDYRKWGILTIFAFYILHNYRNLSSMAAYFVLIVHNLSECWAFPGIFMIQCYNGRRGKQMKYFYYFFYPGHLLLLYFLRRYLMGN